MPDLVGSFDSESEMSRNENADGDSDDDLDGLVLIVSMPGIFNFLIPCCLEVYRMQFK